MPNKICSKCKVDKPLSEYYKQKGKKQGVRSQCKPCVNQQNHSPARKKYWENYYKANRQRILDYQKEYSKLNKDKISKRWTRWKNNDPLNYLSCNIRTAIREAYRKKNTIKTSNTETILGISIPQFREYLIINCLDKYGYYLDIPSIYHLDHIVPISWAETEEDVIKLNHYTNFQLLLVEDNLRKSNKIGD